MSAKLDSTQFRKRRHLGIAHYLIKMLHRILSETDRNSRGEINAFLCIFIDWKQAYPRQSHILGVKSFILHGVRPSLIPVMISYFQSREMRINSMEPYLSQGKCQAQELWAPAQETKSLVHKQITTLAVFPKKTGLNLWMIFLCQK